MRHWFCLLFFLLLGLVFGYVLYPYGSIEPVLRYGMYSYCLLVILPVHYLYLQKQIVDDLFNALAVFQLSQFVRVMALLVAGVFLWILDSTLMKPGLVLFLAYIGSFLFFQLVNAIGVGFCGLKG